MLFLMAGGGTGGHVIPALAVAREISREGHTVLFVGTERGVEARLVPTAGFRLEFIRVGGLKNLGLATRFTSIWRLFSETLGQIRRFAEWKPAAVFSMGGYVAGPPVLAALVRGVPLVVMEPNAVPGVTNRWIGRWVRRALIAFGETSRYFPEGRTELTGLPVREEFFRIPARQPEPEFTVLITGGSQGSQKLNNAARQSWPLFQRGRTACKADPSDRPRDARRTRERLRQDRTGGSRIRIHQRHARSVRRGRSRRVPRGGGRGFRTCRGRQAFDTRPVSLRCR